MHFCSFTVIYLGLKLYFVSLLLIRHLYEESLGAASVLKSSAVECSCMWEMQKYICGYNS